MEFRVVSDRIESYSKDGREYSNRRLIVLGASDDLAEQLCVINLPADAAPVGAGTEIEFKIREISGMFSGKPHLRGELVSGS